MSRAPSSQASVLPRVLGTMSARIAWEAAAGRSQRCCVRWRGPWPSVNRPWLPQRRHGFLPRIPATTRAGRRRIRRSLRLRNGARSSLHRAQNRQVLECPVLYRSGALGRIRTSDPRNRNPMLYPAELRAPWPGLGRNREAPDRRLASQHIERRSDGFELAERPTNKKPSPPRFDTGSEARSYQVVLKRPKWGCCATSIIGRPCCGAGWVRATLRLGCCACVCGAWP